VENLNGKKLESKSDRSSGMSNFRFIGDRNPIKMIIRLLWIMMILVGSSASAAQSGLQMVSDSANRKQVNLNDIPAHLFTENIFPYLSTEDALNFLSSPFAHIKSILTIWNPKRRLKLLKKALENNDPAFEDNYLLRYAAAKGMKDVVELLLNYPTVDPRAKNNWALILAKENQHEMVYELLAERSLENDIETGLINSSQALLIDLINAESNNQREEIQQHRDLKLLLETSTKILPHAKDAICEAIQLGKTDLAKMMLFFTAFEDSFLMNQIVLIKQMMKGNSFKDIRKIDPFIYGRESIFVDAVRSGNFELAELILDKAFKFNPIWPITIPLLYGKILDNLDSVLRIIKEMNGNGYMIPLDLIDRLKKRYSWELLKQWTLGGLHFLSLLFYLFPPWRDWKVVYGCIYMIDVVIMHLFYVIQNRLKHD
jgi:hypothetical protein